MAASIIRTSGCSQAGSLDWKPATSVLVVCDAQHLLHQVQILPRIGKINTARPPTPYMALSDREKMVAIISNGIAVYSLLQERGSLPEGTTLYDFVLRVVPNDAKKELSAGLIDEVYGYVSRNYMQE